MTPCLVMAHNFLKFDVKMRSVSCMHAMLAGFHLYSSWNVVCELLSYDAVDHSAGCGAAILGQCRLMNLIWWMRPTVVRLVMW